MSAKPKATDLRAALLPMTDDSNSLLGNKNQCFRGECVPFGLLLSHDTSLGYAAT